MVLFDDPNSIAARKMNEIHDRMERCGNKGRHIGYLGRDQTEVARVSGESRVSVYRCRDCGDVYYSSASG